MQHKLPDGSCPPATDAGEGYYQTWRPASQNPSDPLYNYCQLFMQRGDPAVNGTVHGPVDPKTVEDNNKLPPGPGPQPDTDYADKTDDTDKTDKTGKTDNTYLFAALLAGGAALLYYLYS